MIDSMSYVNEPTILIVREDAELPPDLATVRETFVSWLATG